MAERPVFIPDVDEPGFVREISLTIPWASGFAPIQKQKNISSLHSAARNAGLGPLLEISTKSDELAGQRLSAFNLKVMSNVGEIPLECAYQGSKVFERGGPFADLYEADPRAAKRDPRLQQSGRIVRFEFDRISFPLYPRTVFYDWLYLTAVYPYREWLTKRLDNEHVKYAGFTDIEFNPGKSINCQARSCALFVALQQNKLLDVAMASPNAFIELMLSEARRRPPAEPYKRLSV